VSKLPSLQVNTVSNVLTRLIPPQVCSYLWKLYKCCYWLWARHSTFKWQNKWSWL